MKRMLFLTNCPAPYRVRFFDELGKTTDVTVLFSDRPSDHKDRDAKWYIPSSGGFRAIQLERRVNLGRHWVCLDVADWLKKDFDHIIVGGYGNPTLMYAIFYMQLHKIPFTMEVDGGVIRQDGAAKKWLKTALISAPRYWISSGSAPDDYLIHYGARREGIVHYPFSSLEEKDILQTPADAEEKAALRRELNIPYKRMLLSVGQFIPRKGFDVLMKAAASLEPEMGIYIIGGEAPESYLQLREELGLKNIHFLCFMKKEELARYYRAADAFVLPTREDIWGLVINEAMAYGLPVVTTDRCVAGLELVEDGVNGYVVPVDDVQALADRLRRVMESDLYQMGQASLEKIRPYTIENMAKVHEEFIYKNEG